MQRSKSELIDRPRRAAGGSSGTGFREYRRDRVVDLFGLDVDRPDHLAPLLDFCSDKLAKIGGHHRHWRAAQVEQPGLYLWIDESGVDFLVELLDDVSRCVLGRTETLPPAGLITRYELADRRNVWQNLQARCGRHRQRAELAGSDVLDRRSPAGEAQLRLSAEQVGESGRVTAIRHVGHARAGHHHK